MSPPPTATWHLCVVAPEEGAEGMFYMEEAMGPFLGEVIHYL